MAKLLETGLVNMDRIEILWRPLTGHLLEVAFNDIINSTDIENYMVRVKFKQL